MPTEFKSKLSWGGGGVGEAKWSRNFKGFQFMMMMMMMMIMEIMMMMMVMIIIMRMIY